MRKRIPLITLRESITGRIKMRKIILWRLRRQMRRGRARGKSEREERAELDGRFNHNDRDSNHSHYSRNNYGACRKWLQLATGPWPIGLENLVQFWIDLKLTR